MAIAEAFAPAAGAWPLHVLLDHGYWINLARAANGREAVPGTEEALRLARQGVAAGLTAFPLTAENHAETRCVGNRGRRERLASFMLELSRFQTMLKLGAIQILEVGQVAHDELGTAEFYRMYSVYGHGAGFMNGEALETARDPLQFCFDLSEFAQLSGRSRPEDHRESMTEKRSWFEEMEAVGREGLTSAHRAEWRSMVVRQTRELFHEGGSYRLALEGLGIGHRLDEFYRVAGDRLVLSVPTLRVLADLRYLAYCDARNPMVSNDYFDVRLLQAGLPYADAVATDARWASTVRNSHVERRAEVIGSMVELAQWLGRVVGPASG